MRLHRVDVYVGTRLSAFRARSGLTQAELARSFGISPSEVEMCEAGRARIGAHRLLQFAGALDQPVRAFFHAAECTDQTTESAWAKLPPLLSCETLRLVRQVPNGILKRAVCDALVSFALGEESRVPAP